MRQKTDESKKDRDGWVFLTSEVDFFFRQPLREPPVHLLSGGEQVECSLALSGTSILSGSPCGRANSTCLTSGTRWSTGINNTPFFLLILGMKFISIHLRAVGTRRTHSEKTTARQGRVSSWQRDQSRSEGTLFPLSHPWNIYWHNPSSLDQLHTCHGCTINYECVSNKDWSHWFLWPLWDGSTRRDFLSVVF